MHRLMIASDVHGSALYCAKLMERFNEERADGLLLLGDLLYHGPRNDLPEGYDTKRVMAMLNGMAQSLICVRGNCDAEVDQMVLSFPIMAEQAVLSLGGCTLRAVHGHHLDSFVPSGAEDEVLLYGHTHVPVCEKVNGVLRMNPGSVSLPKQGSCHSYMVFAEGLFQWKDVLTGETYREHRMINRQ